MKKRGELDTPGSAWRNTDLDEPVFILVGRDVLAPKAIRAWADLAEVAGVRIDKVLEARNLAAEMESWQVANGSKVPD